MAVKIRLRRMGSKKAPFYRVVVADSRYPRNGRFIEEIGTYDILKKPSEFNVDAEAVKKWIANGAQLIQLRLFLRRTALLNNQSRKGNQNAGITYCNSTGSC